MTISGETIDYGPCAFMEAYDPAAVFSSIDTQGRYAYGNQPLIARWNLARFAETLLPLIADDDGARRSREATRGDRRVPGRSIAAHLLAGQRAKLGLRRSTAPTRRRARSPTTGSRCCTRSASTSRSAGGAWPMRPTATRRRCARCSPTRPRSMPGSSAGASAARARTTARPDAGATARAARMRRVNPWIIPRNHRVEEALAAASDARRPRPVRAAAGRAARSPSTRAPSRARYAEPAPRRGHGLLPDVLRHLTASQAARVHPVPSAAQAAVNGSRCWLSRRLAAAPAASSSAARNGRCSRSGYAPGSPGAPARPPRTARPARPR